ncbi:DNA repair protein RecO (recombination protein O) [Azospirillum agricola]|uniref:DNA repair protein RecO n=1 Tax=Azospirillum agricola TaxID=1720247 RepID=UPI001AE644FB|nr:DNA repair protein RecO [Azospirillum agricola]MBP2229245.1 DNA repair protein RecO (recombination protein O) [Azospirillum agricola]
MEWSDQGILLSSRPQGEGSAVATLLTREHGRHAGLVMGGRSPRLRGALEPGTLVAARWRGRLAEHLGHFTLEPVRGYAAAFFDDPAALAALASACALVEAAAPEHDPHPALFDGLLALFGLLDAPAWAEAYVRWEIGLLAELGFGLDLDRCAVSGANDYLAYVSPRTGRAVTASVGEPYRDRLLPLPDFLAGRGGGGPAEVEHGLRLTGHFLERHLLNGPLPPARERLRERYANAVARPR